VLNYIERLIESEPKSVPGNEYLKNASVHNKIVPLKHSLHFSLADLYFKYISTLYLSRGRYHLILSQTLFYTGELVHTRRGNHFNAV